MRFRRSAGALSRALRILLAAGGLLALVGIGAGLGAYLVFVRDLPDLQSLSDYHPALASRVLDRNGQTIGQFFSERRQLTPLASVPPHVVNAFVAGEDSTFFEHEGIDFASILRAAWVNLRTGGEIKQGGSTITQQMVKGLLLSPERTYRRKIREMILALEHRAALHEAGDPLPLSEPDLLRTRRLRDRRGRADATSARTCRS